jgi:cytochrome b involved in lipid metabolism
MSNASEKKFTTIINKYPTHRDEYVKGCWKWLKGRRADDNAEGLWRINDKLYDLTSFINRHPGGRDWLILTKVHLFKNILMKKFINFVIQGTDITEAFEIYHLSSKPAELLPKFYVREAKEPRNYRLTLHDDGFFKTFKRRCLKRLETIDVKAHEWKCKLIFDLLLICFLVLACMSAVFKDTNLSYFLAVGAGIFATLMGNASHNFIHKRNSWRIYASHFFLVNFREARVIHIMVSHMKFSDELFFKFIQFQSHHPYSNSLCDLETSFYEPYLNFMPIKKSSFRILFSYFIIPFLYTLAPFMAIIYR